MEAKDLRIGNYLEMLFTSAIEGGQSYWAVGTVNEKDFAGIIAYPDNYKPIQLTEEWLLRFGFEYSGGMGYKSPYNTSYWHFSLSNRFVPSIYDRHTVPSDGYVGCEYVHQLQNLHFALKGQELTISDNGQTPH
jgi:hypothetical protein